MWFSGGNEEKEGKVALGEILPYGSEKERFIAQEPRDGAEVLSAQADAPQEAERKNSTCSVRSDTFASVVEHRLTQRDDFTEVVAYSSRSALMGSTRVAR